MLLFLPTRLCHICFGEWMHERWSVQFTRRWPSSSRRTEYLTGVVLTSYWTVLAGTHAGKKAWNKCNFRWFGVLLKQGHASIAKIDQYWSIVPPRFNAHNSCSFTFHSTYSPLSFPVTPRVYIVIGGRLQPVTWDNNATLFSVPLQYRKIRHMETRRFH